MSRDLSEEDHFLLACAWSDNVLLNTPRKYENRSAEADTPDNADGGKEANAPVWEMLTTTSDDELFTFQNNRLVGRYMLDGVRLAPEDYTTRSALSAIATSQVAEQPGGFMPKQLVSTAGMNLPDEVLRDKFDVTRFERAFSENIRLPITVKLSVRAAAGGDSKSYEEHVTLSKLKGLLESTELVVTRNNRARAALMSAFRTLVLAAEMAAILTIGDTDRERPSLGWAFADTSSNNYNVTLNAIRRSLADEMYELVRPVMNSTLIDELTSHILRSMRTQCQDATEQKNFVTYVNRPEIQEQVRMVVTLQVLDIIGVGSEAMHYADEVFKETKLYAIKAAERLAKARRA
jgi:hypothetical protein